MKKIVMILFYLAVFCCAQANDNASFMASNKIPLLHIETVGQKPIVDKVNYVDGALFISVPENGRWTALASSDEMVGLQIRGRGNWSWYQSPKKAYKIKFNTKTPVLGMPANKHFALICYDPYYSTMWLAPSIGLELGRLVGFSWTPQIEPVEVILNGEYRGIYLLVETIRTDKERLNITTQPENSVDEAMLPYGWLVELDNQEDDYQIVIPSKNKTGKLRVTHKEPELLSDMQTDWLIKEFSNLTQLIESPDLRSDDEWTNHFDLESIAKYMVVRELLHDVDGYSGSQYFYKDINSEKWFAGPLWDMELWPQDKPGWIVDYGAWSLLNWIPYMMNSSKLRDTFVNVWDNFYPDKFNNIFNFIDSFQLLYNEADSANTVRWPEENTSLASKIEMAKQRLKYNAEWIDQNKVWQVDTTTQVATKPMVDNWVSIKLSDEILWVESLLSPLDRVEVISLHGNCTVIEKTTNKYCCMIKIGNLNRGIYIVKVVTHANDVVIKKLAYCYNK